MLFVLRATRRKATARSDETLFIRSRRTDITMGHQAPPPRLARLLRSMIQWRAGTFRLLLMKFQGIGEISRCDKEVEIRCESKTYKII